MDNGISVITAFLAGVVSFLSPCVLPMIPTYTAYLAGTGSSGAGGGSQVRLLTNAVFFLSGFTLVFVAMGATASLFGQVLFDYQDLIRKTGAVFMIIMGVHLTGIFRDFPLGERISSPAFSCFSWPFRRRGDGGGIFHWLDAMCRPDSGLNFSICRFDRLNGIWSRSAGSLFRWLLFTLFGYRIAAEPLRK